MKAIVFSIMDHVEVQQNRTAETLLTKTAYYKNKEGLESRYWHFTINIPQCFTQNSSFKVIAHLMTWWTPSPPFTPHRFAFSPHRFAFSPSSVKIGRRIPFIGCLSNPSLHILHHLHHPSLSALRVKTRRELRL